MPKENVRAAARIEKPVAAGAGAGTVALGTMPGFECGWWVTSWSIEADEGRVDEELKRADEEDVSGPPLEVEVCVPALPLR